MLPSKDILKIEVDTLEKASVFHEWFCKLGVACDETSMSHVDQQEIYLSEHCHLSQFRFSIFLNVITLFSAHVSSSYSDGWQTGLYHLQLQEN